MHVLNLATDGRSAIFAQQVEVLQSQGVETTTLEVPGERRVTDEGISSRSLLDYVRLYPRALRHSFGSYDLVHANYGLTLPAALAQPSLPVVVTLWGSDLLGRYGTPIGWLARRADAVIVRTAEMAEVVGTAAHVIPHGVNLRRFRPLPRRDARRAVGWDRDAVHVLFPYPISRDVKDYDRAKRVASSVDERLDRPVRLQTLSNVPHGRMPLYYNAADALLLTSKREGSPNSVKEALACNLPVVATAVGDVRDRVRDVDPSHVGTTDQELVDGLEDVIARGPPENGRAAVEPLSLDHMGARLREIYDSVS